MRDNAQPDQKNKTDHTRDKLRIRLLYFRAARVSQQVSARLIPPSIKPRVGEQDLLKLLAEVDVVLVSVSSQPLGWCSSELSPACMMR